MPTYVYGCKQHPDYRPEVVHAFAEEPLIVCPECGERMRRVPQAFRYYMNPGLLLLDKMRDKFVDYRKRRQAHGRSH